MDAAMTGSAPTHATTGHVDENRKLRLGMLFYVLTDAILVVFLLASYVWLRGYNEGGGWFPFKGMQLPDQQTSNILLGMILLSALSYFIAYRGIRAGSQTVLKVGMIVALGLLIATLVGQLRFMGAQQFSVGDGSFASMYILLSGYHVYHLTLGLFLGIGVTNRALHGLYSREKSTGLQAIGYFWYWMALTPVLVTLLVLLLPPNL
jgi:cytochrome c oxidase subunit 3